MINNRGMAAHLRMAATRMALLCCSAVVLAACINIDVLSLFDSRIAAERKQLALLIDYEQCVEQSDANPANPVGDPVRCEKMFDELDTLTW